MKKQQTDITTTRNAKGFDECKHSAERGGQIANHTRKEIEQELGKPIATKENYLHLETKKKKMIN